MIHDFRSHPAGRSYERVGSRLLHGTFQNARHAEIRQTHTALRIDENVSRFDVSTRDIQRSPPPMKEI